MSRPSKSITQAQIAREAGVSQAAVSAILSGSGIVNVGDETRAKVLEIAAKLGYVSRKPVAKNESSSSGRQSVLLVENERGREPTNEEWLKNAYESFLGKILTTSGRHLQQRGISLSVFHLDEPQKLIQWLADSDVAGVLWHANDSDSTLLHWVASRFPMVMLNREWISAVPFDTVSVDQEKNILVAAEHLWSLGHRRIATFGHFPSNSLYRRRMAAYHQFVEERKLRNYDEFQKISDALDVPALKKVGAIIETWKNLGADAPTALITSDVFALPLLREAKAAGIDIPGDLSVIGIDNTTPCSLVDPPLTSMEESLEEMCRIAVDLLLRRKTDPAEPSLAVQIAPRLIIRQSAGPLHAETPAHSSFSPNLKN